MPLPYDTLPVPERITRLRRTLFGAPPTTTFDRARLVTESYRATEGQHPALRRARALDAVFDRIPIMIREGELIVGTRSGRVSGADVHPEYSLRGLTEQETPPEIWAYWQGRTIADLVAPRLSEPCRQANAELAAGFSTGMASGFGHMIVDYPKVLNVGFDAIVAEANGHAAGLDANDPRRAWYEAVAIVGRGIVRWAERHAELAEALAADEDDTIRREELARIAITCRRVPARPARDFREALQAFWFVQVALHIEQKAWSVSAGRFDQYMWPFFDQDLMDGTLDREGAWELLLCQWLKFMEGRSGPQHTTQFQNLTLGGQNADGVCQSNALSHLCLDATIALRVNEPALSVRWHPNINPAFWEDVQRAVAQGTGLPALFNDEVIIAALMDGGVPRDEAVGYGLVGCVEACVPGAMQGVTSGGHINVAKALELALNEGRSMTTGRAYGAPTPPPESFAGFDDLWEAYERQVLRLADLNLETTWAAGEVQKLAGHCPLTSCLLDDCMAQGRDLVEGGVRYRLPGIAIYGPTNVYDGLMAILTHVCRHGRLSWAELRRALLANWEGYEAVRQMMARGGPRFGNDEVEVDALAVRVNAVHADYCRGFTDARGGRFTCGVWPVEGHIGAGRSTWATPDGRRAGEPLVDGVGACQGADRRGPTALLQSVARLDNVHNWPAGNTCNIKYSPASLDLPDGLARFSELNTTFMHLGGQQLQINVIDAATLRAAQADPEAYPDLIVRVAGFSAYFCQLARATQNEIISRTEHRV